MSTLRDDTSRMILGNLDIPLLIVMNPNPTELNIASSKSTNETQTLGGWVDEHWGNQRDIITCSGISKAKIGNADKNSPFSNHNIVESNRQLTQGHGSEQHAEVDKAVMRLEQIYKLDKERVLGLLNACKGVFGSGGIVNALNKGNLKQKITSDKINSLYNLSQSFLIYKYNIYLGFFTDFSRKEDSKDPRVTSYSFTFKVTYSSVDFISQSLANNFPESRFLGLFKQVGNIGKSSSVAYKALERNLRASLF